MQNYNNNLAYDFELFAPKENKAKVVELHEKEKKVQSKTRAKNAENSAGAFSATLKRTVSIVCVAMLVLTFVFLRLQGELQNSELNAKINSAKTQVETLKSEQVRLEMQLENIVSFDNIEVAAKEMGMQKQDAAQTTYVTLSSGDNAEIIKNDDSSLFSLLASLF